MSWRCIVLLMLRDLLFTVPDETIEHRLDQAFFRGEMIQDPALAQFGLTRHRLHRQTHHAVAEHNTLRSSEDELDCLGCRFLAFHDAGLYRLDGIVVNASMAVWFHVYAEGGSGNARRYHVPRPTGYRRVTEVGNCRLHCRNRHPGTHSTVRPDAECLCPSPCARSSGTDIPGHC